MKIKIIIGICIITLISICSASVISQSAIASILQGIMSPAHTEKAMHLINIAGTRANKNILPTVIASNDCRSPRITELPTVYARDDPHTANEMELPRAFVTTDGRLISTEPRAWSDLMYPAQQKVVREPKISLRQMYETAPVARENVGCSCGVGLPVATPRNPYLSAMTPAPNSYLPVSAPNPYLPVSAPNPYLPVPAPNSYLPGSIPNPFLPAAYPSSATASCFLPPPTQSKGQFLRKIPISPPMI